MWNGSPLGTPILCLYLLVIYHMIMPICRDIAMIDSRGNVELVTNRDDLIRNGKGELIEHWIIERVLSSHDDVKGAQVSDI